MPLFTLFFLALFALCPARALALVNCGITVAASSAPQRILAYGNPALENLLALLPPPAAAQRIIGVAGYQPQHDTGASAAALALPAAMTWPGGPPGPESLLLMHPDLVYSSSWYWLHSPETATRERLRLWGIASYLSPAECHSQQTRPDTPLTFETIFGELRDLGTLLNIRSDTVLAHAREQLAVLHQRANRLPDYRLVWWYSGLSSPFIAGCCGAPDMLSRAAGSHNLFSNIPALWPNVSWEEIVTRDPDLLILADLSRGGPGDSARSKIDFLEHTPLTAGMRAVREKRILILPGYDMDPSIRSIAALNRLLTLLTTRTHDD